MNVNEQRKNLAFWLGNGSVSKIFKDIIKLDH